MTMTTPKCAKCGNDGSKAGLYLTIDAKFQPGKGWELEERTDDGGMELDCLACDHRTPVDDGTEGGPVSGFPYGFLPRDIEELRNPAAMRDALNALIPHVADEVEQRKESGNAEYYADLEAALDQALEAVRAAKEA